MYKSSTRMELLTGNILRDHLLFEKQGDSERELKERKKKGKKGGMEERKKAKKKKKKKGTRECPRQWSGKTLSSPQPMGTPKLQLFTEKLLMRMS